MFYGMYQNARDSAWKCLFDFEIDSFPVDVLSITRKTGIRVIKNSLVNDLLPGERGKAYFNGIKWFIIYDDTQSVNYSRFTIAHELGHIFLGHALKHAQYANVQEFGTKSPVENQADAFALRLLAPACVLMSLNLYDAESISKYCKIPLSYAKRRATRMKELRKRNKFFTDPMEQKVFDNFKEYIDSQLSSNTQK